MDELQRKYHEVADIFPLMTGEEFDALKADIAVNGQREPIWLHPDGSIIDGRNRHRACIDLDIAPHFRTWDGNGSLVAFVVSLNLHRRHLTSGQKAIIAAEILPMLEAEAKERQLSTLKQNADSPLLKFLSNGATDDDRNDSTAAAPAAAITGTNRTYVSEAKSLLQNAPDLAEQVKAGDIKITEARRQLAQRQKQEAPPLPTNKYRVWYADPPWAYGNAGVIGETDNYGHAQRHYPTMTIDELCAMGPDIKAACEDDAVLFMWVTSPLLEECFPVIKAWGFKYKTSFVWDKVGHNFGHYNSVRHELLLVCTRGSCTPDEKTLYDSVITVEKSRTHSEKPEAFRRMIDSLYTWGNRIELFARCNADGWDSWGNENGAS